MLRKHILTKGPIGETPSPDVLDIPSRAVVLVSSEAPDHPVDNLFDASRGPAGSHWTAADDGEQTLILVFDAPQAIRGIGIEAEERDRTRTQVLVLSLSDDGGRSYRERIRQEFNFSPAGTTFQREQWAVPADGITHLRVTVRPDKGDAPGRASLTSLTLR